MKTVSKTVESIWGEGYEQVTFFYDEKSGTRSIISIHNTNLGPSLGGTRIYPYATTDDALYDVLRLSRGMTYKAAIANLPLGGGKSIIQADPKKQKTPDMLKSHAEFVHSLRGRYITAEDSGTTREDIDIMRQYTPYVVGTSEENGGSGDPSPHTARGVFLGMRVAAKEVMGKDLDECRVALQGVGNVGIHLVHTLSQAGAKLIIADVDKKRLERVRQEVEVEVVDTDKIHAVDCDIFCPSALGGILNEETIPQLKCKVVAGGANNQLKDDSSGEALFERGIFYAPDYVINAGGLISVCCEWLKYSDQKRDKLVGKIEETIAEIIDGANKQNKATYLIARRLAESRFLRK